MYYLVDYNVVLRDHNEIRNYFSGANDTPLYFFPVVIEPSHLEWINVWPLVYEIPEVEPHEIAEPSTVEYIDGQWVQQWTIRDRTPEEMPEPEPEPEQPPVDPDPEQPVQSGN